MRTSFLSRSVIAVASLAIGPVTLAAIPATAAPLPSVTREQVLAAINSVRTGERDSQERTVDEQLFEIARSSCGYSEQDDSVYFYAVPAESGQSVEGLLLDVFIDNGRDVNLIRQHCAIALLASTDPRLTLSGTLTLSGATADVYPGGPETPVTPIVSQLSGDVFVSEPITSLNTFDSPVYISSASFVASGNAAGTISVTTTKDVTVERARTEQGQKTSKAKYDKRLKAAKKWYAKKIAKAGNSKAKKAAAKKTYSAKKAAYKKAHNKRYFGIRTDSTTTDRAESRPFNLTASF